MTSAIEERVVEMKFDNQDFEKNVKTSLNTIDRLKAALDFRGASKGMEEISKAADKVDVSNIVKGIETVQAKFSAMQIVGYTVIQQLTLSFLNFGKKLWDISFGQMKTGGMSRALKIEQANFKMRALLKNMEGIGDQEDKIAAKMDEIGNSIDRAVTGTAYGYDAAANVAAQLMASGMTDASKMYDYLRGIAGAAAMTGRSFEDIGNIFTTISSNGKLMTMQLRQFSASGLNVSAELARQWNTTEAAINEMVTKGEISFQDFAQAMYDAFGEAAGEADKTYAGVTTNIRAQLSRIGQIFAEPYIQNMIPALQKLKAMLVSLKNALVPVGKRFDTFMKVTSGWLENFFESVDFGRLDNFLRGIENIFWGFAMVLVYVKQAFTEMFPPRSLDELNAAAVGFEKFTEAILPTENALEGIKNIVKAILVPIQFFIKKVKNISTAMQPVIIAAVQLMYTLLSLVGHIGNLIVIMTDGIRNSEGFNAIMAMIGYTIASVIIVLEQFLAVIDTIIMSFKKSDVGSRLSSLVKETSDLIVHLIVGALYLVISAILKISSLINPENVMRLLTGIASALGFILTGIKFIILSIINGLRVIAKSDGILSGIFKIIKSIGKVIKSFFTGENSEAHINSLKDALSNLKDKLRETGDAIKEFFSNIDGKEVMLYLFAFAFISVIFTFRQLLSTLTETVFQVKRTMQNVANFTQTLTLIKNLAMRAKVFMYFASSILLIVGALYELTSLPTEKLIPASAILLGFASAILLFSSIILMASKSLNMLPNQNGAINAISKFIFSFSIALLAMSLTLKILSEMNLTAKQALTTVGLFISIVTGMSIASFILYKFANNNLNKSAFAFIAFAIACNILVKTLGKISKEEIKVSWQNIVFLLGTIISIGAALSLTGNISFGSSFVVLAYAVLLKTILSAFVDIAAMPLETLKKGLDRIFDIVQQFLPLILFIGLANRLAGGVGSFANGTTLIVALTVFTLVVSSVIKTFTKIEDPKKLDTAVNIIERLVASLTSAFVAVLAVMGVITYFTAGKVSLPVNSLEMGKLKVQKIGIGLRGFAAIFIGMSVAVALLAAALNGLAKSSASPDNMWKALGFITLLLIEITVFVGVALFATRFTQWSKLGTTLVVMTTAITLIGAIVSSIALLGMIPDKNIPVIQQIIPELVKMIIAFAVLIGAFAVYAAFSKKELLGIQGKQGSVAEIFGVALAITAFMGAMFLIVDTYVKNFDKFKNGFSDFVPLLAIIGSFSVLLVALAIAIGFIKVESKKVSIKPDDAIRMGYLTGVVIIIFGVVLATIAALAYYSTKIDNNQASRVLMLSISIGIIMVTIGGIYALMSRTMKTLPKDVANISTLLKIAGSIALMSSVFVIIGAGIALLANSLQNASVTDILPLIGAMMVMLGEISVILIYFSKQPIPGDNIGNILAFAGGITAMSAVFIAIAVALKTIPSNLTFWGGLGRVAILSLLVSELAGLLYACNKFSKGIHYSNILAFAGGITAMSAVFIAIAVAINILSESADYAWQSFGILALITALIGAINVVALIVSRNATPLSNAGMIAFALSILAFSVGMLAISEAIKHLSEALETISVDELRHITGTLTILTLVMAAFLAIGAVAGAMSGGLVAASILATAAGFFLFGKALYYVTTALNTYIDTMIKMQQQNISVNELVDSIIDGFTSITNRIDDIIKSIYTVIYSVAVAIIAAAPIIASAIALAMAQTVVYIFIAFLTLGDTLLHGIYLISEMLASWMEEEGSATFYNFGYIIGSAVVSGIVGAFDGLVGKIRDKVFGNENITDVAKQKYDSSMLRSDIDSLEVEDPDFWHSSVNVFDRKNEEKYKEAVDRVKADAGYINDFFDDLDNGQVSMYNIDNALRNIIEDTNNLNTSYEKSGRGFQEYNNDLQRVLSENVNYNKIITDVLNGLNEALNNDKITTEQYEDALIDLYNSLSEYSSTNIDSKDTEALEDYNTWLEYIADSYKKASDNAQKFNDNVVSISSGGGTHFGDPDQNTNYTSSGAGVRFGDPDQAAEAGKTDGEIYNYEFRSAAFHAGGGGGPHALNNITTIVPSKAAYYNAGLQNGNAYNDGLDDSLKDENGSEKESIIAELFESAKEGLKEFAEIANIPINIDTTNALSVIDEVKDLIPPEIRSKWDIVFNGVDTNSEEYQKALEEANRNLGGQRQYERAGYESADAYARHVLGLDEDTEGYDRYKKILGLDDLIDDMKEAAEADYKKAINDSKESLNDYSQSADAAAEATSRLQESIASALDIFSGFNVELNMTAYDVLRSFSSQLIGVSSWSQELQALSGRGIAQAVLDDLAEAGPQAYDRVHALYTMSSAELALFNKMYSQKLSLEKTTANNIRASFDKNGQIIIDEAAEIGVEAGTALSEGINQAAAETASIGVNEMEQGVLDAYKLGYEYEYINGVIIPEGIKDSIIKATPSVAAIFGEMGYQSMDAFMHYMNVEDAITMVDGFQETLKDSIANSINIFDAVSEKEEITAEEMLHRMQENVKNVGKWANNLSTLAARGIDEGLLAELQALGPQGADKVAAFAKMTDAQLRQANQAFAAKAALPQYVADNLTKSYANAGFQTTLGFVEGIDPTAAQEVMTALGTTSLDALKEALDIHSPSQRTYEAGMYTVLGLIGGITDNLPLIDDAGQAMGSAIIASMASDPEKLSESIAMFYTAFGAAMNNGLQSFAASESMSFFKQTILDMLTDSVGDMVIEPTIRPVVDMSNMSSKSGIMDILSNGLSIIPTIGRATEANSAMKSTKDYTNDIREVNNNLVRTRDEVVAMRKDVTGLQTAFAGLSVTLDGTAVGKVVTPYVNQLLGQLYVRDKRGSMR